MQESSKTDPDSPKRGAGGTDLPKSTETSENTDPCLQAGLQHITNKQALNACSERFKAHIPMKRRSLNWDDIVEAAYRLRPTLRISQESWAEACMTLGKNGAAICLLITDQATLRDKNPVLKPAGYFASMITRGKKGDLNLQKSIFGLLKRDSALF